MEGEDRVFYYDDANVRGRIREFLGAGASEDFTCHHLIAGDLLSVHLHEPRTVSELDGLLGKQNEIFRSLWDRTALIADLDVEYVNFDRPEKVYADPESVFNLQAPVERAIAELLSEYGISHLHLLSGRGHHFLWQISRDSPAYRRLSELGRGPPSLWESDGRAQPPDGQGVAAELSRAFSGLGMVMEFLAHRIQEIAAPLCELPVELTAVETGPRNVDREMISIDISEYGDPLHSRMVRVPFSLYLKPWQQRGVITDEFLANLPAMFVIPVGQMGTQEDLAMMRDGKRTAQLARSVSTRIPDASEGTDGLIAAYTKSKLARFHDMFYAQEHEPRERWPSTYDRAPLDQLPGCARFVLEQPNDLLLRPSCIRRVVRVMLALGWHPRHIAGLIRSKYERDYGWTQFSDTDPATRADFYTRIFSGLFATGRDDLVDFNCRSSQEQGLCFFSECHDNLLRFKDSALHRRYHDKLACRPFNRLLLPTEHS